MKNTYTFKSKDFTLAFCSLDDAILIEPTDKIAIISLNDPDIKPELDYTQWKHCLRLRFNDISDPEEGEIFTSRMAESIIEFATALPKEVTFLMTHCFAGVSRSAGVVKFLSSYVFPQCFNPEFDADYSHYNKTVYQTLVKAWTKRNIKEENHR